MDTNLNRETNINSLLYQQIALEIDKLFGMLIDIARQAGQWKPNVNFWGRLKHLFGAELPRNPHLEQLLHSGSLTLYTELNRVFNRFNLLLEDEQVVARIIPALEAAREQLKAIIKKNIIDIQNPQGVVAAVQGMQQTASQPAPVSTSAPAPASTSTGQFDYWGNYQSLPMRSPAARQASAAIGATPPTKTASSIQPPSEKGTNAGMGPLKSVDIGSLRSGMSNPAEAPAAQSLSTPTNTAPVKPKDEEEPNDDLLAYFGASVALNYITLLPEKLESEKDQVSDSEYQALEQKYKEIEKKLQALFTTEIPNFNEFITPNDVGHIMNVIGELFIQEKLTIGKVKEELEKHQASGSHQIIEEPDRTNLINLSKAVRSFIRPLTKGIPSKIRRGKKAPEVMERPNPTSDGDYILRYIVQFFQLQRHIAYQKAFAEGGKDAAKEAPIGYTAFEAVKQEITSLLQERDAPQEKIAEVLDILNKFKIRDKKNKILGKMDKIFIQQWFDNSAPLRDIFDSTVSESMVSFYKNLLKENRSTLLPVEKSKIRSLSIKDRIKVYLTKIKVS